jgi:outer membrane immunogenic protein
VPKFFSAVVGVVALVITSCAVASPASTFAARWTGFYVGANAGWSWLKSDDVGIGGGTTVLISQPTTVPYSVGLRPDGFLGGMQIGYNHQFMSRWVAGLEADFDFADIKDSNTVFLSAGGPPTVATSASEKMRWLGTVRGRLGWLASPTFLLFGTGGLAFGRVDYAGNIEEFPGIPGRLFAASASFTKFGWTIGGGAEWEFARNWSVKAEYLYYDLGSETITGPQTNPVDPTQFATYSFTTRGSIARAGINLRFGP